MITAYNTANAYNIDATYWGEDGTNRPVISVEIDTLSDYFVLVEGDSNYGGVTSYDTSNTYNTTVVVSYDGLVKFRDITSNVRSIDIRRGRGPLAFNQFEAGTLALELVDTDSEFLPSNTSSIHYPRLTPMRPIRVLAQWSGNTFSLFRGYIDSIDMTWYPGADVATVTIQATDLFKVLNTIDTTVTGSAGDTPGARVAAILNSFSFPASLRSIDTGTVTLQPFSGNRQTALNALQAIERAESGAVYIDGAGRVVFRDRNDAFPAGASTRTFADTGATGAVEYAEIDVALDDQLLYNRVAVTRTGGVEQVVTDTTSVDTYQRRTLQVTDIPLADDTQAATLASFLLAKRKDPGLRVQSIGIKTYKTFQAIAAAMNTDLLDVINVIRSAPSSTFQDDLVVSGISHQITADDWDTTFTTQHQA